MRRAREWHGRDGNPRTPQVTPSICCASKGIPDLGANSLLVDKLVLSVHNVNHLPVDADFSIRPNGLFRRKFIGGRTKNVLVQNRLGREQFGRKKLKSSNKGIVE
jgi:hypothetical protein